MKLAFVSVAVLFLVLILAFASTVYMQSASAAVAVPAQLNEPFKLKIGQQATINSEKISISFLNVTEDSRCPSDVVCIWQGQASIRISTEINGTNAGQFVLTVGGNEKSAVLGGGKYSIKMTGLEPYPVSTNHAELKDYIAILVVSKAAANSAGVYVRAAAVGSSSGQERGNIAAISGWSLNSGKGTLVILSRESATAANSKMTIARFMPIEAHCNNQGTKQCIDGHIVDSRGIEGDTLHLEVSDKMLYLTVGGSNYTLDIRQLKIRPQPSTITLSEGQRDGPLLVQEIGADYVKGLNYAEYPIARLDGVPITLHIGDTASNGCTVTLTLLKTEQHNWALFSKKVDYSRPCPL